MTNNDSGFVGSIPDLYDRNVGPLMMVPYAGDIAARLSDLATGTVAGSCSGYRHRHCCVGAGVTARPAYRH